MILMFISGKLRRTTLIVAFLGGSVLANAQTASMWFNKFGDSSSLQPSTIEVLPGSTVKLSVYLSTASFANNLSAINVMFGYDSTTSTGTSAVPAGSGLTVAYGGTNSSPTGVPITWNTAGLPGGSVLNKFGGGNDSSSSARPFGLWTSILNIGDFGFANTPAIKLFDIDVTVSNTLTNGTLRPITIYSAPTHNGTYDSSVSDSASINRFPATYVANLQVVPEPASMAAVGLGVALLARRRKSGAK